MKKIIITMVALLTAVTGMKAMGYEQAREQALFLTDKMAYELNLSQEQYEAAYEINLDYLMSVNTVDDVYADYWRQRNLDMQAIFFDWQWTAFCAATYFYRPLYWDAGVWHFGIYAHYPHRNFFYFSRPTVWATYRGGHSWRYNGGRSWWAHHAPALRPAAHRGMRHHAAPAPHHGTAPRHNVGSPRHSSPSGHGVAPRSGNFGRNSMGSRPSSTRTTVGERPATTNSSSTFGRNSNGSTSRGSMGGHGAGSTSTRSSFGTGSHSSMGGHSAGGASMGSNRSGGASMGGHSSGASIGSRGGGSSSAGGHSGGARGGRR